MDRTYSASGEARNQYNNLVGKPEGNKATWRPRHKLEILLVFMEEKYVKNYKHGDTAKL